MKLEPSFYHRKKVTTISRDLLGKALITKVKGQVSSGIIVETEAYSWKERGCHAYNGRKTLRNEVMFDAGGKVYVYLCYGIHHLFNVVTNREGIAEAVLVRAVEPLEGIELMMKRRRDVPVHQLTSGPGKLTRALGIDRSWNGKVLWNDDVWIEDIGRKVSARQLEVSKRIGIDYAGEDANLLWRFSIRDNKWVSR
jgi:DNA-3-methyladenine glycosylase